MKKLEINLHNGISKEGKPYRCVQVVIGDWSTLIFPNTKFEMDYIEKYIKNED